MAIDTATDTAGIALRSSDALLAEESWTTRRRHTVQLAPRVKRMLDEHEVAPADLGGIAVAIGPGSYTGLRIGLSLAKGLALGAGLDVVGVPTLDVLAASLSPPVVMRRASLWAVLRAGRGRVVAAAYPAVDTDDSPRPESQRNWPDPRALKVWSVGDLLRHVAPGDWVAGELDAELRTALRRAGCHVPVPEADVRRAGWLAAIGLRRTSDPARPSPAALSPVYLR